MKSSIKPLNIMEIWTKVMGHTIAKYTQRIKIINHRLIVHTSVPALKDALKVKSIDIIKQVNSFLNDDSINDFEVSVEK